VFVFVFVFGCVFNIVLNSSDLWFDDLASIADGLSLVGIAYHRTSRAPSLDELLCLAICPPLRSVDLEAALDCAEPDKVSELAVIA